MRALRTFGVNHYHHFTGQQAEANQAFFSVVLPPVFAGDGEVIPYGVTVSKVEPVFLEVRSAFGFVPYEHV